MTSSSSLFSSGGGAGSSSGANERARKSAISLAFSNGSATGPNAPLRDRLAARSRVTNLGIVLLLSATALSMLLNLRYLALGGASRPPRGFASWSSFHGTTPDELKANLPAPPPGSNRLDHLVIVTGHAIWAGCDFEGRSKDENWILEPYQVGGSIETYWKHIEKGLEIADADPKALLVFSGGQTRTVSLQTEAESYFSLAIASGMNIPTLQGFDFSFNSTSSHSHKSNSKAISASSDDVLGKGAHANAGVPTAKGLAGVRMTTENFALDSYQNFLFSIARFREYTGVYPERITVVGYGMKKSRFEELHAKAVRWPIKNFVRGQKRFHYVGIDDQGDTKPEYEGEKIKGFALFERDMYGCHGRLLSKRRDRNPTRRFHPYYTSAPEIADLLNWCPGDNLGLQGVYRDSLPWDLRVAGELSGWGRATTKFREEHQGKSGWSGVGDSRWLDVGRERQ
ncbi:hypothetical protein BDZ90DRAFT_232149 [Jaminaea rosea]|uniref:Uncharacterized protein n=1 Tax=Jaminaea rosea TaxID=1569628 RepID=A0A316URZ6_9BASI|nr:hypothetical protein BDZ90DRAFT_232149 [Jaminaea rosea]PWN27754.1 hypothetical protein BDZ90DRAFT_232149 [Jaminaea rosea]